jgi:hypothetical protein
MTSDPGITCRQCKGLIPEGDKFCPHCGKELTDLDRQIGSALEHGDQEGASREVRKAVKWMIALGVMFIIFGTIFGLKQHSDADAARSVLQSLPDEMVVPEQIGGKTYTVAELREQIDFEVYAVFGINYLMALVLFGLSFWARRSPFPAMLSALCLYLALIVLNAIIDPMTLIQGWLIKILFFAAMIGGIKAALRARNLASSPNG